MVARITPSSRSRVEIEAVDDRERLRGTTPDATDAIAAVLEILSGSGLIHRSGTVAPDPLPLLPDYVPYDWLPPAA